MQEWGFMRVLFAIAVLAVVAILSPAAAQGAPQDEPALDQYADPFGPLPTQEQSRDFDPLSGDFGVPSARLLRQLEGVDEADRALLAALVTQVSTAKKRVREGAGPERSAASGESDSDALDGTAASLVDLGGPGAWLLAAAAALAVVAALRARAIHSR